MKKLAILLIVLILVIGGLSACGKEETAKQLSAEKLVVGVTSGPHEEIFEVVQKVAKEDGLEIELKVFSDYVMPNTALDEGEIDVNSYQHKPFMNQFNQDHSTNLVAITPTILSPIGVYSEKVTDLNDLERGAKIGIPGDPTNSARALMIFEEAGLITLKDDIKKEEATVLDIQDNDKELEFIELDAAQIPKQLGEFGAAVINGNYALTNGLDPDKDTILLEKKDSPFVNYLVTREENKNDPVLRTLEKAYHSDEVKQFIETKYKGALLPGW